MEYLIHSTCGPPQLVFQIVLVFVLSHHALGMVRLSLPAASQVIHISTVYIFLLTMSGILIRLL